MLKRPAASCGHAFMGGLGVSVFVALQEAEEAGCGALLVALAAIDEELHERRWSVKSR